MNRKQLRRILNACLFGLVGAMLVDYFGFSNISFSLAAVSALAAGGAYFYHQHQIAKRRKKP